MDELLPWFRNGNEKINCTNKIVLQSTRKLEREKTSGGNGKNLSKLAPTERVCESRQSDVSSHSRTEGLLNARKKMPKNEN